MQTDIITRKVASLKYLSQDQIWEIHRATLELLETTGVKVFEEEALALLKEAGAWVDGNSVRIPGYLIEEALRSAPKRITLANRDGKREVFLEDSKVYFGTGSDTPYVYDPDTGEIRSAVKKDVETAARICDYLPHIDFVMSMGLLSDYHPRVQDIHQFTAMISNTKKPVIFTSHNRRTLEYKIAIAEMVAGGSEKLRNNPFVALYTEPSSPLMHSKEAVEKLLLCAEKFLPVVYTVGVMAGATAPVTSAGLMIIANAELLSGLLMAQLKQKGAPVIYGGMVTVMDMATGIFSYNAPELYRRQAAMSEMAKFYGLPIFGVGGCSDSCAFDVQAGIEQGYTLLMAALSGVNLVHDVGYLGQGMISSWDMIVSSNETIGLIKQMLKSVDVGKEDLALDVISEVGPGGNFLSHPHTMEHFKEELWMPKLANRKSYVNWKQEGCITYEKKVRQEVKNIIENYRCEELPEDVRKGIEKLLQCAEKELVQ